MQRKDLKVGDDIMWCPADHAWADPYFVFERRHVRILSLDNWTVDTDRHAPVWFERLVGTRQVMTQAHRVLRRTTMVLVGFVDEQGDLQREGGLIHAEAVQLRTLRCAWSEGRAIITEAQDAMDLRVAAVDAEHQSHFDDAMRTLRDRATPINATLDEEGYVTLSVTDFAHLVSEATLDSCDC